jgi:signal transduction histidine kinase
LLPMKAMEAPRKLKVLLVDDDEDDFLLTKDLFADINPDRYEVEWVNSFEAAARLAAPHRFDVCLLDYRLGENTGLELLRLLQEQGYRCPMILLTGQGDSEVDNMAMRAGAADYLVKGELSADKLERSVRYAVQQRQIAEERVREQEARARAEAANQAKDEFLATLSHELRTPLNVMLGWVQLLKKNSLDEEMQRQAVDAIERSARMQTQLVDDLLDIARINSNTLELARQPIDLAAVIEPAATGLRPIAENKNVTLEIELSGENCIVNGDPHRLQQVVNNLLSNAIKFAPGGLVKLKMDDLGDTCRITVTDNGKGISADFLPHIFDRYSQSRDVQSGRKGGLGLGLAIVRRIVEMHGGSVRAHSEGDGKGASFTVELPKLRDD